MFLYHPPYIASALISLDLFLLYVKEPPKDILQWGFGPRNQVLVLKLTVRESLELFQEPEDYPPYCCFQ